MSYLDQITVDSTTYDLQDSGAQRVTLTESSAPTTSTVGVVGQHYIDTSATVPPYEYVCINVSSGTYTWEPIGENEIYVGDTTPTGIAQQLWIDTGSSGTLQNVVCSVNGISPTSGGNVLLSPTNIGFTSVKYYVNGSTGNNSNDGKTSATAFQTISRALNVISANQYVPAQVCIHIQAGTYNENISKYPWSGLYLELRAEGGNVTISGLRVVGASMLHFTSSDNSQYGFNFVKGTSTSTYLLSVAFEKVYTECPISFDPGNDSNIDTLVCSSGCQFVIGYRGQLTFTNVAKSTCFTLNYSTMINTWGSITATPTVYDSCHSIVQGISNLTTTGTVLSV